MKIRTYFLIVLMTVVMIASCKKEEKETIIPVESVSLSDKEITLVEGESFTLTVSIIPEDATNTEVAFESENPEIATVSQEGKVQAVKPGNTIITVITADGNKKDRCNVLVKEMLHPVEKVELDIHETEIEVGKSIQLNAAISPENASNKNLIWESSDSEIAKVADNGLVIGLKEGKCNVTVKSEDGNKTDMCEVTVITPFIPVESISIDFEELELFPENSFKITATIFPENATNRNISWSSSDESIVTVDKDGYVTGVSEGEATVTVTTEDGGKTAKCHITVVGKTLPDYIDEYGINHGQGIKIGEIIWAPVNCGYKAPEGKNTGYPYGKLYQYGRKDGHGYVEGDKYMDETFPSSTRENPSSLDEADPNTFYQEWNETLAPAGTWGGEDGKTKTKYDPCPEGWRVPTMAEIKTLKMDAADMSSGSTYKDKETLHETKGRWFGPNHKTATFENPNGCIFLQLSGYRDNTGFCKDRERFGYYASSDTLCIMMASFIIMPENPVSHNWEFSIRCVADQE